MRIFVTGGNGFIGYNFILKALKEGEYVMAPVRRRMQLNSSRLAKLTKVEPNLEIVDGDVRDYGQMTKWIGQFSPQVVIHLAAESHVAKSIQDPMSHIDTNIRGTHVMMTACRDLGIPLYMHMSTCEVYGPTLKDEMVSEDSPFFPSSPYAASKAGADLLVQSYYSTYGMNAVILRPANNFGPYQSDEKVIPKFIQQAQHRGKITVHGTGEQTREWIDVSLFSEAALHLAHSYAYKQCLNVYNISNNDEVSINDIAHMVQEFVDCDIEHIEDRPGQVSRFRMDNHRLSLEYGTEDEKLSQPVDIWPKQKLRDKIPSLIKCYK